jgi:hypothetical protein
MESTVTHGVPFDSSSPPERRFVCLRSRGGP